MLKSSDEKDCGTKICELDERFVESCTIYVDESEGAACLYPCSLDHCTPEVHHWVTCPIWSCSDKTTTTLSPSTTTPPHSNGHDCSSALCISSVSINVLLLVVGMAVLSFFLVRRYRNNQTSRQAHTLENPLFDFFSNERPIIRARSETLPLLSNPERGIRFFNHGRRENERDAESALLETTFGATSTARSSHSSFLNPSAPDLAYVEMNF